MAFGVVRCDFSLIIPSTANVGIESDYAIPGNGVYAAMTQVEGKNYYSVVNIGNKLTFHD